MRAALAGKCVVVFGRGGQLQREVVLALAENGARLALATREAGAEQEFAVASIANEAWALGADQFVKVLNSDDGPALRAFAGEVCERLGHCDAVVVMSGPAADRGPVPSGRTGDEEEHVLASVTSVFRPSIERSGGGTIVWVADPGRPSNERPRQRMALEDLARDLSSSGSNGDVLVRVIDGETSAVPGAVCAALASAG